MSWLRIDDGWADHPKVRKAGRDGRALWVSCAVKVAQSGTDGIVEDFHLTDWAYLADVVGERKVAAAAAALVRSGLWHDADTIEDCERCCTKVEKLGGMPGGAHYFHDWEDKQATKDEQEEPVVLLAKRRLEQLHRMKSRKQEIIERDGSLCRYCGVRLGPSKDTKSPISLTYDHVDPDGTNELENVVMACRTCNGRKGHRTPEEAGMTLWGPRTTAMAIAAGTAVALIVPPTAVDPSHGSPRQIDPGTDPESTPDRTRPTLTREATGRVGPGRSGSVSGRSGSGRAGKGRGGAGKARAGAGREPP